MKILEVTDADVGLRTKPDARYTTRTAARAVLRKGNLIALLHVSTHHYYKLPGGGVDEGETIDAALKREIQEEVGCTCRVLGKIGEIVEHRSQSNVLQTSHCFMAEVEKEGKPDFTEEEIQDGFEVVWVTLDEAVTLLKKSKPDTYDGKFIIKRDLAFLEQAEK